MADPNNHSPKDFFTESKRQDREFLDSIATAKVGDIFGVVSAGGAGGVRNHNGPWSLVFHLVGWKHLNDKLRTDELRVEMQVSEEALDLFRKQINAYDIVGVDLFSEEIQCLLGDWHLDS